MLRRLFLGVIFGALCCANVFPSQLYAAERGDIASPLLFKEGLGVVEPASAPPRYVHRRVVVFDRLHGVLLFYRVNLPIHSASSPVSHGYHEASAQEEIGVMAVADAEHRHAIFAPEHPTSPTVPMREDSVRVPRAREQSHEQRVTDRHVWGEGITTVW